MVNSEIIEEDIIGYTILVKENKNVVKITEQIRKTSQNN